MTPDGVYIRIFGSTKPPQWLPHFVPDTLLLHEIAYQTYVNGVVASLHRKNKGIWPPFPLSSKVCKIENFKTCQRWSWYIELLQIKRSYFQKTWSPGKLKEHLQQVGFIWSYSHEDLLPGELSQQQVLVKSRTPTSDQMTRVDKEAEIQKSKAEKRKAAIEWKSLSGSRMNKNHHHLHQWQCIASI